MTDIDDRMMELAAGGLGCSQLLMALALEERGESNPELVRSMTGLLGGMFRGRVCGALSGACCVLALYAGNGSENECMDVRLETMLAEMNAWFEKEFGERYGGTDCAAILPDPAMRLARCTEIIGRTYEEILVILENNGFSPSGRG